VSLASSANPKNDAFGAFVCGSERALELKPRSVGSIAGGYYI